jgi:uncharacterized membrane protein
MPGIYACGILSILIWLNVLFVDNCVFDALHFNKYYAGLITIIIMFVNYILYYKFTTPQQIEKKWKNASKKKIRIMNIISIVYVFLTIFLFVLSVYIMHYR